MSDELAGTDPRELTAGYTRVGGKGVAAYRGVLREGRRDVPEWVCSGHQPHMIPLLAQRCAEAERERRIQGTLHVLWTLHCQPCGVWYDISPETAMDMAGELMRGKCPRCTGPVGRVRIAILERENRSVR